jgi:hypothetical protein
MFHGECSSEQFAPDCSPSNSNMVKDFAGGDQTWRTELSPCPHFRPTADQRAGKGRSWTYLSPATDFAARSIKDATACGCEI